MRFDRNELSEMSLQRLAYVLPESMEEEDLVKEIFDQRASVSSYQTLISVDVKQGWQEGILQKYVDIRRESMAPENPAELGPEDQEALDAQNITKEKELELQAKLDAKNGRVKAEETPIDSFSSTDTITISSELAQAPNEETTTEDEITLVKKRGRPSKK